MCFKKSAWVGLNKIKKKRGRERGLNNSLFILTTMVYQDKICQWIITLARDGRLSASIAGGLYNALGCSILQGYQTYGKVGRDWVYWLRYESCLAQDVVLVAEAHRNSFVSERVLKGTSKFARQKNIFTLRPKDSGPWAWDTVVKELPTNEHTLYSLTFAESNADCQWGTAIFFWQILIKLSRSRANISLQTKQTSLQFPVYVISTCSSFCAC
jgi:hypothetical protein